MTLDARQLSRSSSRYRKEGQTQARFALRVDRRPRYVCIQTQGRSGSMPWLPMTQNRRWPSGAAVPYLQQLVLLICTSAQDVAPWAAALGTLRGSWEAVVCSSPNRQKGAAGIMEGNKWEGWRQPGRQVQTCVRADGNE